MEKNNFKNQEGNPQLEDGFVKIANELLEALTKAMASGLITAREGALINYIIRYTYGFNKPNGYFRNKEISENLNWKTYWTSFVVTSLVRKNIIIKEGNNLRINKHYKEWSKIKIEESCEQSQYCEQSQQENIVNNHNNIVNNHNNIVNNHNFDTSQTQSQSEDTGSLNTLLNTSLKNNKYNSVFSFKNKKELKNQKKNVSADEQVKIPDWLDIELWNEFKKHRKAIKHPITPYAEKLLIKKLDKWRAEYDIREIIETSIENGWQGLFEPKKDKKEVYRKESPIV